MAPKIAPQIEYPGRMLRKEASLRHAAALVIASGRKKNGNFTLSIRHASKTFKLNYATLREYVLNPVRKYHALSGAPRALSKAADDAAVKKLRSEDAANKAVDNNRIKTVISELNTGKPPGWVPSDRQVAKFKEKHAARPAKVVTLSKAPTEVGQAQIEDWLKGWYKFTKPIPEYLQVVIDETSIVGSSVRKQKLVTFGVNEHGRRRILIWGVIPFHITLVNFIVRSGAYLPACILVPFGSGLKNTDFPNWIGLAIYTTPSGWMTGDIFPDMLDHINLHLHKRPAPAGLLQSTIGPKPQYLQTITVQGHINCD
jgi:hypothetical protein